MFVMRTLSFRLVGYLVRYVPKDHIHPGIAGAAKTTTCRCLLRLIDPNFSDLGALGASMDDLYIGAHNRHVLGFDNISRISPEMSDALCRVSTGAGHRKRQLRTDAEEFMMQACRPILLNGIPSDLADPGDLADRSIVVELEALDEDTQIGEKEFWEGFEEAQPHMLGALLNGVVGALRGARGVSLAGYGRVRMTDFAKWAEAGCRALGFEEGEFLTAFVSNHERAMRIAFQQDPVAQAIALLIDQNPEGWRGNVRPLLVELEKAVKKAKKSDLLEDKRWPKNDTWLGRNIRRSAAVLRKVADIEIKFEVDLREDKAGDKDGLEIKRRRH
jgi:putative DNA primase/helicase